MTPTTPSPHSRSDDTRSVGRVTVGPGAETPIDPTEPSGRSRVVIAHADRPGSERIELDGLRAALAADPTAFAWIDLEAPSRGQVAEVARLLDLHPLVAENIGEHNQRAKVDQVEGSVHVVLFVLAYVGEVHTVEVDFVLGERFLISVHDAGWDPAGAPLLRIDVGAYLGRGPDLLLYAIADWIVDDYFPVLDRLADEIDQLQDDVVDTASRWTLEKLFVLKRELIAVRRATSPAREIFNQLTNRDITVIRPPHVVYFRDVYDHLIRVTDELDNYRELVSGTLDVYLSTVNNNLAVIVKRLTGVTVILAGIGALAGVFGMSEAGAVFAGAEAAGFWIVTAAIVALAGTVALVLRRIDWI
jgi:magnesium transporter